MGEPVSPYSFLIENLTTRDDDFKLSKYVKQFVSLKTNKDRVNFVYKDLLKFPDFVCFQKDEKDDAVAVQKRENGNDSFKLANFREALDWYTDSILSAKSASVLALGYANRSAALSKLNLHKECLEDIERALQHGYPDHLKPKLIKRRNISKTMKLTNEKYYEAVPTFSDSEKNLSIEAARNCVKITKNQQYGRCVMATRDIKIGEILSIEKPYAAVIKDQIYVHCHQCFELCYNLIPCNNCTKALYCGVSCKDKAFTTYHNYECSILLTLDSLVIDPPKRLALKMVFMAKDELESDTSEDKEMYCSHRFKEIYNLEGHVGKRHHHDLLGRSAYAAVFLHLIKNHTSFLEDGVGEDRLKEIILLMVLICGINTVDINELAPTGMSYNISPTAIGIYSFFTLFNHSCWPNVIRQYHGSTMVQRAVSSIKKGEQCFVIYGPSYPQYSKQFRQSFLASHQFFTCTCRACEENWPPGLNMNHGLCDYFFTMMNLSNADVSAAKKELHQLLVKVKKAERTLSSGQDFSIKDVLTYCYNIFGNKRRI